MWDNADIDQRLLAIVLGPDSFNICNYGEIMILANNQIIIIANPRTSRFNTIVCVNSREINLDVTK